MQIKRLIVGGLQTNCYILVIDNECLIIDPGDNYELIKNNITDKPVLAILITHNHFDHIGALEKLKHYYKCNVYDKYNLEEKEYLIGKFKFEVIYTPGHTSDSITFYFRDDSVMFSGDFIFKNTIGRTDLDTGNSDIMNQSIKKISNYNDDIVIYPGHGDLTVLGFEKENNIYFK